MRPDAFESNSFEEEESNLPFQPQDEFEWVIVELIEMRRSKGHDYGDDTDTFSNISQSANFGVQPWLGAIIRLNDKISRIQAFVKKHNLKNEPIEDSFKDIAVYAIIALVKWRERHKYPNTFPDQEK